MAEMQKPQPMNPELTCWPVSGILDMLNNFRGKGQPFGDQNCISLELPRKVICIVIFSEIMVVHNFLELLHLLCLYSWIAKIKGGLSNV